MSEWIPMLSEADMAPELAERLRERVERLGYLGEFFRYAAHQPRALMSFLSFTEDLKRALPDNLTEVVALSVAGLMKNAYERVQHERLSLKLGFSESWVRDVLALRPEAEGCLSEQESSVQRLVLALIRRHGHATQLELKALVRSIGSEKAIAVLMLVGRYVTHSLIVNSLELPPPLPSPLEGNEP